MWYTTKINDRPALMYFTGDVRVVFDLDDNPMGWKDKYEAWLAEGNTPEPWTGE